MNDNFERKFIAIEMATMPGNHCAENVQKATESIVNKFDFQKNKIKTISCDEGSAYVRLFKQILTTDIEKNLENSHNPSNIDNATEPINVNEIMIQSDMESDVSNNNRNIEHRITIQ